MRRLVLLLLLLAPAALAQDPPARPALMGIFGKDDRQPFEPVDRPWSAIGRLNREAGGFCTGTLVGPRQVLTAAHCLRHPRTKAMLPAHTLHFVAGYRRGEYAVHRRAASYVTGEGKGAEADWAVVTLSDDTGIKPLPVRTGDTPMSAALLRAGYSQDRAHLPTRAANCSVQGTPPGLLLHDCDATRGDSGSALLTREGGELAVVGLHVGTLSGPQTVNVGVPAASFAAAVKGKR
ncbi:MAG TPA: trypsin-like serine protease [Azospirillaceae bacterium]|nr:trypsin-like serine protease [Azospirillaceae bacterium]